MKTLTTILAVAFLTTAAPVYAGDFQATINWGDGSRSGHPKGGGYGHTRHRANGCNVGVRFHPTGSCIYDRWGNLRGSGLQHRSKSTIDWGDGSRTRH